MKNFKKLIIFLLIFTSNSKTQTGWLNILCCCTSAETKRKKDTTNSKRKNSSTPKTTATNSENSTANNTARRKNSKQNSLEDNNNRYKTLQAYINSEDSDSSQAKSINDQVTQEFQEATEQNTSKNNHDQYETHPLYSNLAVHSSLQERSINDQVKQQAQEIADHNRPSTTPTIVSPINKNSFMQQPTTLKLQYSSTRENSFNQQLSHSYRDSLRSNENPISNNKPAEATSNMVIDIQNQVSLLPHVPVVNSSSNLSQKDQNTSIQNPVLPSTKSNFGHFSSAEMKRLNIASSCSSTPKDNAWINKARRAKSSESPQSESPQDYNF